MVVEFDEFIVSLVGVDNKFVIVPSRGNVVSLWTPFEAAYLLTMSPVTVD